MHGQQNIIISTCPGIVTAGARFLRDKAVALGETIRDHILRVQPTRCNVSQFIYFCTTLYMFQTVFPSIIRSSNLHIQRQTNIATCCQPSRLAAGSSNGLTHT